MPPIELFHEFFWLFATENDVNESELLGMMLRGSHDEIKEVNFRNRNVVFDGYKDFWDYCVKQFGDVSNRSR